MAGFDEVDPANSCLLGGPSNVWLARRAHDGRADFQPNPERPARWTRDVRYPESTPCNGDLGVANNMHVNDRMTGHRKTPSKRNTGKEVLQFAPNFTAYVLPPDVVC